jgi:aryl-alcohol dehydrogenase-like predicted oxidoreductase
MNGSTLVEDLCHPQSSSWVARLALGTVQFGLPYGVANTRGQIKFEDARTMLRYASNAGIDTLDTAIGYGEAETVLGRIGVSAFRIISKVPAIREHLSAADDWLVAQVEASLERLGVSRLNGLMLHAPDDLLGPYRAKIVSGLDRVKKTGLVERIGLSVYSPEQLATVIDMMPIEILQIPFNVFDRRFAQTGWLDKLASSGVEVHARSAFLQGLLLMPIELVPPKFAAFSPLINNWHAWIAGHETGASPVQVCLAHVAAYTGIARIVVGADSPNQLHEIIEATRSSPCEAPASLASDDSTLINPTAWNTL